MIPPELQLALADRYRLEREIGAGGMATVYLAEDVRHHRKVAVKVLREDLGASLGADRFVREISIAANLTHPHILPLYDSGEAGGRLFYVMPYVDGATLRERLAQGGELPIVDAVRLLRDIADAMAYAHARGVVHRDIKPENVMLSGRHALVTDFGVAKALGEATGSSKLTTIGIALGTPAYMAPEQATADPLTDHRADIYAFGVVAYELLTGRAPFTGNSPQEVLAAHVTRAAEPVVVHRASIPAPLAALVMRCLEKRPADRWQRADELVTQLEALATPSGGSAPAILLQKTPRSLKWMGVIAAGVAVAAFGYFVAPKMGGKKTETLKASPPQKIAVLPFENKTGNAAHAELGAMAADWITRGLVEARLAAVVPMHVIEVAKERVGGAVGKRSDDSVLTLVGATKVIAGAYYQAGDSVRFQAELIDVGSSRLLAALPVVVSLPAAAMQALDSLRRGTLVAVATALDTTEMMRTVQLPPSIEAYRLLVQAYRTFWTDYPESERLTRQILAKHPMYAEALAHLAVIYLNQGRVVESDSLLRIVEGLGGVPIAHWLRAKLDGDGASAIQADLADTLTTPQASFTQLGLDYFNVGRFRASVEAFRRVDPLSIENADNPTKWAYPAADYHLLGEYELERGAVAEGLRNVPRASSMLMTRWALGGLAATGRIPELEKMIENARAYPPTTGSLPTTFGEVLNRAGSELLVHGDSVRGREFGRRAVAWFDALDATSRRALLPFVVRAYVLAGQLDAAAKALPTQCQTTLADMACLYLTGAVAALRGDSVSALRRDAQLASLPQRPRSIEGYVSYYRALIAASGGRATAAAEHLRNAGARGIPVWAIAHSDALMLRVFSDGAVQGVLRPRG